jgi:sulfate permease, SulP family
VPVFLTGPLRYLPQCVLGAIIFTIAVGLVELRGLRNILRESAGEFRLVLATAAVVVIGVACSYTRSRPCRPILTVIA